jgi:sterol desaturase/sphingolipid hydroxylase (fatty acid hydroxylase superfamily)
MLMSGLKVSKEAIIEVIKGRDTYFATWPLWLQAICVLTLSDFTAYWLHRAFHRGWLWRVHAVHHSSRELDWLSAVRLHPLNEIIGRMAQVLPFYFLGFSPLVLAGVAPFLSLYAILLHANVSWNFGPLRYVIASPRFHRWHHTSEEEGLDKNFAGLFPIWDLAFGTWYMPTNKQPTVFGIVNHDVPENLWGQLMYPFKRTQQTRANASGIGHPADAT